jgi:hypothetical protein
LSNEKETVKKEQGTCGECKWWDKSTMRDFHRDGVRKNLVEIRSICRSPSSKARGHLTMKESVRPCFEKGNFVAPKKEEPKKPEEEVVTKPKKEKKSKVEPMEKTT